MEVVIGSSVSNPKDVVLFSLYNGECPDTFVFSSSDQFTFGLLDGCYSGNQVYDGPRAYEQWIHLPDGDQKRDVQST